MVTISLSGEKWRTKQDFYDALAVALGCVDWHGRNADAFLDTMVYHTNLNRVQPPYRVVIRDVSHDMRPFLIDFAAWVQDARENRKVEREWGDDVDVSVSVI